MVVKLAYLDCPTGIAGDMLLGALLDAGVPLDYLKSQLSKLGLDQEFQLEKESVTRQGQAGTKAHVHLNAKDHHHGHSDHSHHHGRHWPEIVGLINAAGLPAQAQAWSLAIFENLAKAEGAVHGIPPENVHFHEVGAVDAIVDIVGCCLGLAWLGIEKIYCSPLPTGGGTVKAAHGILPVPVPAVLQLFQQRQVPLYSNQINKELVTPTGAAIAVTLATEFGSPPPMNLRKIGLGAGNQDLEIPNLLRLWLGETDPDALSAPVYISEHILELQTQIDDLSPQALAYTQAQLYEVGAVEVFMQPIQMKKNRLGTLLTVLCPVPLGGACEAVLFAETTTIGIRRQMQERHRLDRKIEVVELPQGKIRIKLSYAGKTPQTLQPEYEDCVQVAQAHQMSWREVHRLATQAAYAKFQPQST